MNEQIKMTKSNLKTIIITCILSSILITVINHFNINLYIKIVIIPFLLMISTYIFLIKKNNLEKNSKIYILIIPILLILFSDIVIKIDYSNKALNIMILPILLTSFFIMLINKNYKITRNSIPLVFKLFPKNLFKNLKSLKKEKNESENFQNKKIINILLGLLIGIPIAVVLLFLLSSADKYFGEFVSFITEFISSIISVNNLFSNIFTFAVTFSIFFSVFLNIVKNKNLKVKPIEYKKSNNVVVITILSLVNFVFILFLISEISKLTINFLHLPIEYTYAEYAREGFFQLLAVTSINFGILLYFLYYTKIIESSRIVKNLLILLIAFSIILIFNSYYRMFLYISTFGFTILRLQVILFLIMELTLFYVLIKKIVKGLKNRDAVIFTIIILSFYILNLYLCTDKIINFVNKIINF